MDGLDPTPGRQVLDHHGRMIRSVVAALAVLVTVLGGAAPATAAAPTIGQWHGQGIGFHISHNPHGTPYLQSAHWHSQTAFHHADIHDGAFETCARHRVNAILARDTCIRGTFTGHHEASGTTGIYQVAHGHRAAQPSETHHWSAALVS
jgi:hypothetical protein